MASLVKQCATQPPGAIIPDIRFVAEWVNQNPGADPVHNQITPIEVAECHRQAIGCLCRYVFRLDDRTLLCGI
jgi:hypothetical protein